MWYCPIDWWISFQNWTWHTNRPQIWDSRLNGCHSCHLISGSRKLRLISALMFRRFKVSNSMNGLVSAEKKLFGAVLWDFHFYGALSLELVGSNKSWQRSAKFLKVFATLKSICAVMCTSSDFAAGSPLLICRALSLFEGNGWKNFKSHTKKKTTRFPSPMKQSPSIWLPFFVFHRCDKIRRLLP